MMQGYRCGSVIDFAIDDGDLAQENRKIESYGIIATEELLNPQKR
jgi:hypothetical protein